MSAIAGAAAALGLWLCISGTAQAEVALFDGVSGLVTIPPVSVGSATYVNVTLRYNGNLTFTPRDAFTMVMIAPGISLQNVRAIAVGTDTGGQDTSYFLFADGSVLAAGAVTVGATTSQAKPAPMQDATGTVFAGANSISAQFRQALAVRTDNTVWGWGNNLWLNLADGTNVSRASPVRVQGLAS